jgi:hypothetical protein
VRPGTPRAQTASSPAAVRPALAPSTASPIDADTVLPGLFTNDGENVQKIPSTAVGKERFDLFFGPYGKSSIYVVRCADLVLPSCLRYSCMRPCAVRLTWPADGRVRTDFAPGACVGGSGEGAHTREEGCIQPALESAPYREEDFSRKDTCCACQAKEDPRGGEGARGKSATELVSQIHSHALDPFEDGDRRRSCRTVLPSVRTMMRFFKYQSVLNVLYWLMCSIEPAAGLTQRTNSFQGHHWILELSATCPRPRRCTCMMHRCARPQTWSIYVRHCHTDVKFQTRQRLRMIIYASGVNAY